MENFIIFQKVLNRLLEKDSNIWVEDIMLEIALCFDPEAKVVFIPEMEEYEENDFLFHRENRFWSEWNFIVNQREVKLFGKDNEFVDKDSLESYIQSTLHEFVSIYEGYTNRKYAFASV